MSNTTDTYASLVQPLPIWSPKNWYYGATKVALSTVGLLSDGVRLGYRFGFDSGVMLEYVYRNKARGQVIIGRLIDRLFLDAPGWKGIRARGSLVQDAITESLRAQSERGVIPKLLDVACGGGRYALGALHDLDGVVSDAVLRDYRVENIDTARALALDLNVSATIEQADAFSDNDLSNLSFNPTVVVVSGLHEIIPDDELIEKHFRQLFCVMAPGGDLLQTIQPHHPQLEFIARVLPSHTGDPWAMRLRDEQTTRSWIEKAGFEVTSVTYERSGIFGLIRAQKPK